MDKSPLIVLKPDHKAELKWTFREKDYDFPRIEFTIDGDNMIVTFTPASWLKKLNGTKKQKLRLKNFRNKLACDILNKYPDFGRHFETGVTTVWRNLGLPLYTVPILKDWRE